MERGIYGLGGFLSVAKELRVLWSTPYLSRLWPLDSFVGRLGRLARGRSLSEVSCFKMFQVAMQHIPLEKA
jgi:hypothetical protein